MKGLVLLFKFMTRLPFPWEPKFDSESLGKSMKWFPVVGMILGLINYGIYTLLSGIIPSPVIMAIILVTMDVIMTGGLHLDGLADTFDGIFSYRSKQKMLEIMKDSRLGTNGGLVLVLYFIFKIALLVELSNDFGISQGAIMALIPVISRLNSVGNCTFAPYARGTGMGKTFVDHTKMPDFIISIVISVIYLYFLGIYFGMGLLPIMILPITIILGVYFAKLMTRKIGGITGDTLGAVLELTGVLGLFLIYIGCSLYMI
ncbi:cobalamin-5'-phosphate synthase [Cetobacterium ceti]|uniref:Adenosylcobinamide-GDP ribazoletransferase n=1 Tax=Cetobacterium ceti TaxID=180163 RepID=A0A1T4KRP0_9FUSO|nr:adenosylcobinamide-GDP ribazoletransferase [Cetobacterium ceti]SJZ45092.1 cobalamin-5'-phosphate synthase [Cetobacterium ceti]